MTYNYSSNKNNGQVTSSVDAVSGETVTYQYDALKRLVTASSTGSWSETYSYDGFGNLTQMTPTGGAPSLSTTADPNTNRANASGVLYDNNGNLTAGLLGSFGYDVANRLTSVGGEYAYAYDNENRRLYYRSSSGTDTIYVGSLRTVPTRCNPDACPATRSVDPAGAAGTFRCHRLSCARTSSHRRRRAYRGLCRTCKARLCVSSAQTKSPF